MAYNKSNAGGKKESPYINVAFEGISFDLSKVNPDVYDTARKYAVEDVKNDAEISFIEENDDDEIEFVFNEDEYSSEIENLTNKYIKNALDLPENGALTFERKNISGEDAIIDAAKQYYSDRYGVPVINIESEKSASVADIRKAKTFEAYQAMYDNDDYTACLELTNNLYNYSHNNIALVFAQKPDAEATKGFTEWKEYKRGVAAGEHAIKIYAPLPKPFKSAEEVKEYIEKNPFYKDQLQRCLDDIQRTGSTTLMTGYKVVNVFDIKQTISLEGKDNLEEVLDKIRCNKALTKDLQNSDAIFEAISSIIEDTFPDMNIQRSKGASDQENVFSIMQSYAERLFAEKPETIPSIKSLQPSKGETHQLETIMGAYLAARHIGVDENDVLKKAAFEMNGILKENEPLKYRQGKHTVFETAFERAVRFSKDFNKSFDKEYEKLQDLQADKDKPKKKEGVERE